MQFIFPKQPLPSIKTKEQLKEFLRFESFITKVNSVFYKISLQKNRYIYARCSKCKCLLTYIKQQRQDNEVFILKQASTMHIHRQINNSNIIENFIKSLPMTMPTHFKKKLTQKQFGLKPSKFYYHHRKTQICGRNFEDTLKWLDRNKFNVKYDPFPLDNQWQIPNILILSSERMIKAFEFYGNSVSFDLTYNVIKEVHEERLENQTLRKKWGLGFFFGKNQLNHAVPLAIVIMNDEKTSSMEAVFQSFFDIMGASKNYPQSIVTDGQLSISAAIKELKKKQIWEGEHLQDSFHYIRNLRKHVEQDDVFEHLRIALMSFHEQEFESNLQHAKRKSKHSKTAEIIRKFQSQAAVTCHSQTMGNFFGLSISSSYHEKINDKIKGLFREQKRANFVIEKVAQYFDKSLAEEKIIKLCRIQYETVFNNQELRLLRHSCCEKVFLNFMKEYVAALSLTLSAVNQQKWRVANQIVRLVDEQFTCTCSYKLRTGISCKHILRVTIQSKASLMNTIGKYWKVHNYLQNDERLNAIKQFALAGRPKLTRRNLMK